MSVEGEGAEGLETLEQRGSGKVGNIMAWEQVYRQRYSMHACLGYHSRLLQGLVKARCGAHPNSNTFDEAASIFRGKGIQSMCDGSGEWSSRNTE